MLGCPKEKGEKLPTTHLRKQHLSIKYTVEILCKIELELSKIVLKFVLIIPSNSF